MSYGRCPWEMLFPDGEWVRCGVRGNMNVHLHPNEGHVFGEVRFKTSELEMLSRKRPENVRKVSSG
jgi:hypothetical protein